MVQNFGLLLVPEVVHNFVVTENKIEAVAADRIVVVVGGILLVAHNFVVVGKIENIVVAGRIVD